MSLLKYFFNQKSNFLVFRKNWTWQKIRFDLKFPTNWPISKLIFFSVTMVWNWPKIGQKMFFLPWTLSFGQHLLKLAIRQPCKHNQPRTHTNTIKRIFTHKQRRTQNTISTLTRYLDIGIAVLEKQKGLMFYLKWTILLAFKMKLDWENMRRFLVLNVKKMYYIKSFK